MTTAEIQEYLRNPQKPNLKYFPYQVAENLSDLAAVLLYDVYARTRDRKKPIKKNGFSWTYDAMEVFVATHPYASESGIRKAFLALETAGLLRIEKTGRYNGRKYDKKWWYALTDDGKKKVARWLMRFEPQVATELDIPKAVLLEHFRHVRHDSANHGEEYVTLDPDELNLPYSAKTLGRHLTHLVALGILEPHPDDADRFRLPVGDIPFDLEPLTVAPNLLLPELSAGEVGLFVAPSATGKTSVSSFVAVQMALAGQRVVYVTVEEPVENIIDRMYAQEFGVVYTDLHQANQATQAEVEKKLNLPSERREILTKNLRFVDLSGQYPHPQKILEQIQQLQDFAPDVVWIDQLEFTTGSLRDGASVVDEPTEENEPDLEDMGIALPRAVLLSEAFHGQPYRTWVVHQVDGNPRADFEGKDVAGGNEVVDLFDKAIGIGRTDEEKAGRAVTTLRLFSLKPGKRKFEAVLDVDFPHMRFKPKKGPKRARNNAR